MEACRRTKVVSGLVVVALLMTACGNGGDSGGGDAAPHLRVDEHGTEAAAVTGGDMPSSAGPRPLKVDRPFVFTVSDRETGTILFLGTVHDPRS